MIKLHNLLNEETFTATNKKTGKTNKPYMKNEGRLSLSKMVNEDLLDIIPYFKKKREAAAKKLADIHYTRKELAYNNVKAVYDTTIKALDNPKYSQDKDAKIKACNDLIWTIVSGAPKNEKINWTKLKTSFDWDELNEFNMMDEIENTFADVLKTKDTTNEGKFKKDDLVYNTRTKTVGIVRMGDDKSGEVKTDADGNVNVDELEKYNPIKSKHQQNAKVAPSTEKEVNSRGLFNPFKSESIKLGNLLEISSIDGLNDILNGQSSQIEGIKISKGMAEHIIDWMRTSPYGKKYNSWVKKNSISTILPIAFNWGLDRGLASELKSEFTALKAKYGKAVKKENTK
jgi:hypothetical protein